MRIDLDRYRTGFLRWRADYCAPYLISPVGSMPVTAEGLLSNGESFAFLPKPLGDDLGVTFHGKRAFSRVEPLGWYERLYDDGKFITDVFDFSGTDVRRIHLIHVPDAGIFHRLVVDAGNLEWDPDFVLREGRDAIRMLSAVHGPWSEGIREERGDRTNYEVFFDVREGSLEGKFVEVVASGDDKYTARVRAFALLGYINVILGPATYGAIRVDAEIDARRGQTERLTLLADDLLRYRVPFDDSAIHLGFTDLPTIANATGSSRLMIALERYSQASSTRSEELSFAALIAGIDAVTSDFYKERGGGDQKRERIQIANEFVSEHLAGADKKMVSRIRDLIISPSFLDRFVFYASEHGLADELVPKFQKIKNQRNNLFHAANSETTHVNLKSAQQIMLEVIAIESGIDRRKMWRFERSMSTAGIWSLQGYGWRDDA